MTDVKKLNIDNLDSTVADEGRRHALKRLGLLAAVGYAVPTLLSLTKAHAGSSDAGDSGDSGDNGDNGGASGSDSGGASSSDSDAGDSGGGSTPTQPSVSSDDTSDTTLPVVTE